MSDVVADAPQKKSSIVTYVWIFVVAFLLGFVPMGWNEHKQSTLRETAEHELVRVRMQNDLAAAALDARRGEYEAARREASAFFTAAHAEIDKPADSALTRQQRDSLLPLLAPRDDVITVLARSDPGSADRLLNLYVAVRKALGV